MAKPIFTALSPNAQRDDIWLAVKLMFMPWMWRKGSGTNRLEKKFKEMFGFKHVFFFESGRTCLYGILKSLKLKKDDEVLIQAYTCVAVPEPVLWNALKPVYVDCDEKTITMDPEDLKRKITKNSRVLIIQHTFGNPAQLDELLKIAEQHDLFVIEDCAHALGSTYNGKPVGTFGDAAFFSFGRDKVISSVFGGAVATKDDTIAKGIEEYYAETRLSSRLWVFRQIIHPVVIGLSKATYSILIGKVLLKFAKKFGLISKAVYREERQGLKPSFIGCRLPNALAMMASAQLSKLDGFNNHRRVLAGYYEENLRDLCYGVQRETPAGKSIHLRYVLQVDDPLKLLKSAAARNIFLGDWYTTGIAPDGVDYAKIHYDPESCPTAEKVARRTINLPTDINTPLSSAERVVKFIKNNHDTQRK